MEGTVRLGLNCEVIESDDLKMTNRKIEWSISVPIFKKSIILKQLGVAIGIPFGLLIIVLLFATKASLYTFYALGLLAVLFLFTYLLIRILWGGMYDVAFVIDSKGIRCYTQRGQARKNRILNGVTVILGLLSGKPAVAGAGFLAQSGQNVLVKWNNIRKVRCDPKGLVITIKGGFAEQIAIFCTTENYIEVETLLKSKFHKQKGI